ncbi:MAG TPA: hypothetical protein VFH38_05845 [Jatrophihabitans sp.]|nr:hypothetical protein [Jatrophihabitans sp.]
MGSAAGILAITAAALLLLVSAYFAWIGAIGVFTRTEWVRCSRCHHHAWSHETEIHAEGCPRSGGHPLWHQLAAVPRHLRVHHVTH